MIGGGVGAGVGLPPPGVGLGVPPPGVGVGLPPPGVGLGMPPLGPPIALLMVLPIALLMVPQPKLIAGMRKIRIPHTKVSNRAYSVVP